MSRLVDKHPLDVLDRYLRLFGESGLGAMLDDDEKRYVAEHKAVGLNENSSLQECAKTVSGLMQVHIPQLNAQLEDKRAGHHYSNPVELIREESKRRENKKMWYTGNIAQAHERIKALDKDIVSEETPAHMRKTLFWSLLLGLLFLGLAIYCCTSGAAVDFVKAVIDSTWFYVIFAVSVLALSLIFGFFSMGILVIGGVFLLAWIILEQPVLSAIIVNGVPCLVAGVLLFVAVFYVWALITYKPLSPEAHELNQQRIAEKETLRQDLRDYSEAMLASLAVIKKKHTDDNAGFLKALQAELGGSYGDGMVYEIFNFLNKYYRKMKR